MRSAADTTGTSTESQELEFIVWPTRQPEALGYLIDIDTPVPTDYAVLVGSKATVRLSEMIHDQGFAWKEPADSWSCLTVTRNFGDFQTGYL
jgi:hypothetical protein